MAVKAVLFDFWGTLVENGTYSPTKGTLSILRTNLDYTDFIVKFEEVLFTKSFESQEEAFKAVCDAFGVNPLPIVISKLIGLWNKNKLFAKPYPETAEVLQKLKDKGVKLAIVSNTHQDAVEEVLEKHDLAKYFDSVVLSYKHGKLKQHGDLYAVALEELGVSKEEALVIGDSIQTDMVGAKAAGIPGLLIDRKGRREYPEKIAALAEIETKLE